MVAKSAFSSLKDGHLTSKTSPITYLGKSIACGSFLEAFLRNRCRLCGKNDKSCCHYDNNMRRLGTIDLEILHLAINQNGTFNESHLENSELKRLGVGKLLDCLATLKDRKMLSLNNTDGSFSITDLAKEILWGKDVPTWAKVLRLLQIKSCGMDEIIDVLKIPREQLAGDIEELRKNQLVLMSPQRQGEKLLKIFEILPEGVQYIDKTDVDGFDSAVFGEPRPQIEAISKIDEIVKEIQDAQLQQSQKDSILAKLYQLKDRLEI